MTTGIFANSCGVTTAGAPPPVAPAFCRMRATTGETVCTPFISTTEYCCGPASCGVVNTMPTGPGASGKAAGRPASGTKGTASSGPTGNASNSAWLIGRAWSTCSGVRPSGRSPARSAASMRERRPWRTTQDSLL
nr:hypothetical protein CPGR_02637 [Mycolicibacter nonchromogenicus]